MSDSGSPEAKTDKNVYRILFISQGEVYEVYAREIYQSELYGFIEVEQFLFGNRTQLVVDPGEEKLKTEMAGVTRSYIPVHLVLRIDEVEKEGVPKVTEAHGGVGNVMPFAPVNNPGGSTISPKKK